MLKDKKIKFINSKINYLIIVPIKITGTTNINILKIID